MEIRRKKGNKEKRSRLSNIKRKKLRKREKNTSLIRKKRRNNKLNQKKLKLQKKRMLKKKVKAKKKQTVNKKKRLRRFRNKRFNQRNKRLYTRQQGRSKAKGRRYKKKRPSIQKNHEEADSVFQEVPFIPTEKIVLTPSNSPLVSIIIPVYNHWKYTYACLKSIDDHTDGIDYEVIVADDQSNDETANIQQYIENIRLMKDGVQRGFLHNCNHASQEARGKYIVFLNNDTEVQENWLRPLVDKMESDSTIGLIGSKLLYLDERLQEAGGIVWRDGSGWNYGRNDQPQQPQYNYVKEVDYISGAAIMTRTDLWHEIGGFDARFAPSYCEDSDYAFEVRRRGYKVVFHPKSLVVHYEGVSHGNDINEGLKSYQTTNQNKLYEKWRDELEREHFNHNEHMYWARDRSGNKKTILVIDHFVPHYDQNTGSRNMYQYLKMFVQMGLNVKFVGYLPARMEPYTSALEEMGIEVLTEPFTHIQVMEWIQTNGAYLDYVYLSRPHIGLMYIDFVKQHTRAKVIYNSQDFHFLREFRRFELDHNPDILASSQAIKKQEFELFQKSDVVYTVSDYEKSILDKELPGTKAVVIPTYIYEQSFPLSVGEKMEHRNHLAFVGAYAHTPNVDGVVWFTQEVFPIIQQRIPGAQFHIIGANPPEQIRALNSDTIQVRGFISDEELNQCYESTRVMIAPLRYGAGVKGKIIESIAYGVPLVTTSIGAEGIMYAEDVMSIAETKEQFADKVIQFYLREPLWQSMRKKQIAYAAKYLTVQYAEQIVRQDIQP